MTIAIDSLITSPTSDQVQADFETSIENLGVPIKSWPKGGTGRTIVAVCAFMYAAYAAIVATIVRAAFLETSAGGWLTYVAYFVYGVTRIDATFATGQVSVTNGSASTITRAVGTMQFLSPSSGKVYTNTAAVSILAGATGSVAVQAVELGSASTAGPGAISALQTPITGATVTNPAAIVGADPESDAALKARCLAKLGTLSPNGPRDAYDYAARSAVRTDGSLVPINRTSVVGNNGTVSVYCATPSGTPSAPDLVFIQASIERYARPDSVAATAYGVTSVAYNPTITVWVRTAPGVDAAVVQLSCSNALTAALATYPIGGIAKTVGATSYLYTDFVSGVLKAATTASVFDVDYSTAGDTALTPGQVAVNASSIVVRLV